MKLVVGAKGFELEMYHREIPNVFEKICTEMINAGFVQQTFDHTFSQSPHTLIIVFLCPGVFHMHPFIHYFKLQNPCDYLSSESHTIKFQRERPSGLKTTI